MKSFIETESRARIFVEVSGEGEAVLFSHADFVDGRMWDAVRASFGDERRTASYDKLGYGRSDAATGPVCRRRELEAVIRGLGLAPAHLVGCSNGGQAALDLALERPELVRSLTLVNSPPSGFEPEGSPPAEILEMIEASQKGDQEAASELQLRIWFDGPSRLPDSLDPAKLVARSEAREMNRIFVERGTFWTAQPAEPLDPPALSRLGEIRLPVLVVSGSLDYSENRRASRLIAESIPGARFVEMAGCAHVPPLEAPQEFAAILRGFLESIASA
jgi:pimeloyl-ACP methyl ester carboxylesterase